MKNRESEGKDNMEKTKPNGPKPIDMKKKKKNMHRLGGAGLSLEAFANAKSTNSHYNPALIKKQREYYKNAKYVSKYKKSQKQQNQQSVIPSAITTQEDDNEEKHSNKLDKRNKKKKKGSHSLKELYEKQQEQKEKARLEREAIIQATKEERERAEAQRKAAREKMLKRTRHGQPVMKYRIEHLLQSIQSSSGSSVNKNT
ncbi:hypothetical protein SLA2020_034770 [Shorea laevis]